MDIYEEGLQDYEYSTKQMLKKLKGSEATSCPLNRSCDGGIRNLQPISETGYEYGSCGAFGDDQEYGIDFNQEMAGEFFTPLRHQRDLAYLKAECLSCPMFNICNGCYKTVNDLKKSNLVEYSCKQMKEVRQRAIKNGLV
jgi:radical SAM protein with 4Fe4S-binding SPASM domain